jgi:hypothetical protein
MEETMSQTELEKVMRVERWHWNVMCHIYGAAYVLVRVYLIAASAVVAAKAGLDDNVRTGFLTDWVALLALLVTIFTALDTWMKPQQKWQGFMQDRDELDTLISSLKDDPADGRDLASLRERFDNLRARHRRENVF